MRRNRVLPGPLKTLPRRRGGSWAASFSLFAGAIIATSVVVAAISNRGTSGDANEPMAQAERPAERAGAGSSVVTDLTPRRVATREPATLPVPPPAPVPVTPETVTTGSRHDETVAPRKVAAGQPAQVDASGDQTSPFRLDLLPVLAEDGSRFGPAYAGLATADMSPVRTASRAPSRRAGAPRDAEAIRLPQP